MQYLSPSLSHTKKLGREFAGKIIKSSAQQKERHAVVVGLIGDLGAGKTSFIQSFLKTLGARGRISSPTFVLVKRHPLKFGRYMQGYHIDAYRVHSPKEIEVLGFGKLTNDPKNILLVEWADRIKKIMPKHTIWIQFKHLKGNKRRIKISRRL